jgi:hypothetical protein
VWDEPAFCNLSEPFIQAGQKLGFLRDLPEFRTRKFWQLGNDFIEAHLSILAYLDRVATLNITRTKGEHCIEGAYPGLTTPDLNSANGIGNHNNQANPTTVGFSLQHHNRSTLPGIGLRVSPTPVLE